MRDTLRRIEGTRARFRATLKRFGKKPGWQGKVLETLLFIDITDLRGNAMCDHVWFTMSGEFKALALKEGDQVEFTATVREYDKGYHGYREDEDMGALPRPSKDYKLFRPWNVCRAGDKIPIETLPLFRDPLRH